MNVNFEWERRNKKNQFLHLLSFLKWQKLLSRFDKYKFNIQTLNIHFFLEPLYQCELRGRQKIRANIYTLSHFGSNINIPRTHAHTLCFPTCVISTAMCDKIKNKQNLKTLVPRNDVSRMYCGPFCLKD